LTWARFDHIDRITVGLETNGIGFMGFLSELPGSFVRGKSRKQALSKVYPEVSSYLKWFHLNLSSKIEISVSQLERSNCHIDDGDSCILLGSDRGVISETDFDELMSLARFSGETFHSLVNQSERRNWIDKARQGSTFYGKKPTTIQEIFEHVGRTQWFYLSRAGVGLEQTQNDFSFMALRKFCLDKLALVYKQDKNSKVWEIDDELWTLKKIMRRFIWHDRIHAKSIVRILEKQKRMKLIERYSDPFFFPDL
jgi:hypothetical protein